MSECWAPSSRDCRATSSESALQGESERSRLPAYRANPKGTKGQKRLADVIGPICQCLERFANDGPALRGNPPDSKRAADVRAHAFAERQHMPPIRQGLEVGSVAGPSPVRIALERDLPLGVCRCLAQEGELFCRHRSAPDGGQLLRERPPGEKEPPRGAAQVSGGSAQGGRHHHYARRDGAALTYVAVHKISEDKSPQSLCA